MPGNRLSGDVDHHYRGDLGGPAGHTGHGRRYRPFELDQVRQVGVAAKILFRHVGRLALFPVRDQLDGGEPGTKATRSRSARGLEQPAHLDVEVRREGAGVAHLGA